MYHRSWTARDGAPQGIWSIAQTTDGFLWLAGNSGLYRFDGLSFRHIPGASLGLPSEEIRRVFGASDGSLWIGYQFGGASRVSAGKTQNFPADKNGLADGSVMDFAEQGGRIWAATTHGLSSFRDGRWELAGTTINYHPGHGAYLRADQFGGLWSSTYGGNLQWLGKRKDTFLQTSIKELTVPGLLTSQDAGWIVGPSGLAVLSRTNSGGWTSTRTQFRQKVEFSWFDSEGSLWMSLPEHGLVHLPETYAAHPGAIRIDQLDEYGKEDGLSGQFILAGFADREGGVWCVTDRGIDYFRRSAFRPIRLPEITYGVALAPRQGTMLAGILSPDSRLLKLDGSSVTPVTANTFSVDSLTVTTNGVVWVGSDGFLTRIDPSGHHHRFALPGHGVLRDIQALAVGKDGRLWVSVRGETPWTLEGEKWSQPPLLQSEPQRTPICMLSASDGSLFLGYPAGLILRLKRGAITRLNEHDRLGLGNITVLGEHGGHIWVGGSKGAALLQDDDLRRIQFQSPEFAQGIAGLVERDNGDLWVFATGNALRVDSTSLASFIEHRAESASATVFNYLDGYPGPPPHIRPLPALATDGSGRLYFGAEASAAWLDPDSLPSSSVPPGTSIDALSVDGVQVPLRKRVQLRATPDEVVFDVFAGTLYIPERARILYKLENFDQDWKDAGSVRRLVYRHLPPGSYTLLVTSISSSGVRSLSTATQMFTVPPTFIQSNWFKALVSIAFALVLGLIYVARVRTITERLRLVYESRRAERHAIARDLHDTFFQSIQGLLLRLHTLASGMEPRLASRSRLEEILNESDQVMLEGRQLLVELRSGHDHERFLPGIVQDLVAELGKVNPSITISCSVSGRIRPLRSEVGIEIVSLTREALWNVLQHSRASTVKIHLEYASREFRWTIVDDGVGIPAEILAAGHRDGHLGLPGMRERAATMPAILSVESSGGGTMLRLSVPAPVAYSQRD